MDRSRDALTQFKEALISSSTLIKSAISAILLSPSSSNSRRAVRSIESILKVSTQLDSISDFSKSIVIGYSLEVLSPLLSLDKLFLFEPYGSFDTFCWIVFTQQQNFSLFPQKSFALTYIHKLTSDMSGEGWMIALIRINQIVAQEVESQGKCKDYEIFITTLVSEGLNDTIEMRLKGRGEDIRASCSKSMNLIFPGNLSFQT